MIIKIITTFSDLYTKIPTRIMVRQYDFLYKKNLGENFFNPANPFSYIIAKRKFFRAVLLLYVKEKHIGKFTYFVSLVATLLREQIVNIKHIFFWSYKLWVFESRPLYSGQEYITCSKGIERAKTTCVDNSELFDFPIKQTCVQLSAVEVIKVINLMVRFRVNSFWHVAQYYILHKSMPTIKAQTLIIEEGGDFVGQLFAYLYRPAVEKIVYTHKTPLLSSSVNFRADVVLTNNLISYLDLAQTNSHVEFLKFNPVTIGEKAVFKFKNVKCIGYAPDIGNHAINFSDKRILDKCIRSYGDANTERFLLSIHPQEKRINLDYYKNFFFSNNFQIRNQENLAEYFSKIDIFVTWWSSMIVQSIYHNVPVIILDFFEDDHADNLVNIAEGMILKARNYGEFKAHVEIFRSASKDTLKRKLSAANNNIFTLHKL